MRRLIEEERAKSSKTQFKQDWSGMQTGSVWYERDNTCHFGRKSDTLPLLLLTSQTKQVTSMKPFFSNKP
jgi:hypothetical protein